MDCRKKSRKAERKRGIARRRLLKHIFESQNHLKWERGNDEDVNYYEFRRKDGSLVVRIRGLQGKVEKFRPTSLGLAPLALSEREKKRSFAGLIDTVDMLHMINSTFK